MSALVAAARAYLGTPFRHTGRTRNGLDCAGLLWRAYADLGVTLPDFRKYGREPENDGLLTHVEAAVGAPVAVAPVTRADLQVGDVVVMRFVEEPHHLAMVTDYLLGGLALIHACGHNRKVIEHRMADDHVRRITHVFRKPV